MNKYNNPRLLNAVVSGTGMKHPIQPHVVVGDESNGFIRGDLMDANAIVDLVNSILHPDEGGNTTPDPYNGHEYVDLGLPSGTKWAKMNVGASSEKEAGLYFAWGETTGYTASQVGTGEGQKAFDWDDYALTEDGGSTFTKYNATDNKTHLELADDAASVNMGGDWHMPNRAQCLELLKETKNGFVTNAGAFTQYVWSDIDGYSSPTETTTTISGWDIAGYFFFKNTYTSVTDAISAEDYLFIPATGDCGDGEVSFVGDYVSVWASALDSERVERAWGFYFDGRNAGVDVRFRCGGQTVRGVVGQMDEIGDNTTPGEEEGPIK